MIKNFNPSFEKFSKELQSNAMISKELQRTCLNIRKIIDTPHKKSPL